MELASPMPHACSLSRCSLTTAASALAAFVALARAVDQRLLSASDHALRDQVQSVRTPASDGAATAVGPLGKEWLHGPVAVGISIHLWSHGAGLRSALPAVASAVSAIGSALFEHTTHIQKPPPGHPSPYEPSFPSGHAFESSAVGLTSAYVLAREGMVNPVPAFAAAVTLSLASTAGRAYLDRHWGSEACGGWLLGIATATTCSAVYECSRTKNESAAPRPSGEVRRTDRTWRPMPDDVIFRLSPHGGPPPEAEILSTRNAQPTLPN